MKDNTVVCGCFNITVNDIKEAIRSGITTYEALQEETNISTECPGCKDVTLPLFQTLLSKA